MKSASISEKVPVSGMLKYTGRETNETTGVTKYFFEKTTTSSFLAPYLVFLTMQYKSLPLLSYNQPVLSALLNVEHLQVIKQLSITPEKEAAGRKKQKKYLNIKL